MKIFVLGAWKQQQPRKVYNIFLSCCIDSRLEDIDSHLHFTMCVGSDISMAEMQGDGESSK